MTQFMGGLLVMGFSIAALYFLRFWRRTRERLFVYFAIAFAVFAIQRIGLAFVDVLPISETWLYGARLAAFLLLLGGILEKNRR